jgi:hypothetical protein
VLTFCGFSTCVFVPGISEAEFLHPTAERPKIPVFGNERRRDEKKQPPPSRSAAKVAAAGVAAGAVAAAGVSAGVGATGDTGGAGAVSNVTAQLANTTLSTAGAVGAAGAAGAGALAAGVGDGAAMVTVSAAKRPQNAQPQNAQPPAQNVVVQPVVVNAQLQVRTVPQIVPQQQAPPAAPGTMVASITGTAGALLTSLNFHRTDGKTSSVWGQRSPAVDPNVRQLQPFQVRRSNFSFVRVLLSWRDLIFALILISP